MAGSDLLSALAGIITKSQTAGIEEDNSCMEDNIIIADHH